MTGNFILLKAPARKIVTSCS